MRILYILLKLITLFFYVNGNGIHQKKCPSNVYFSDMKQINESNVLKPLIKHAKKDTTLMDYIENNIIPNVEYINIIENIIYNDKIKFKTGKDLQWNSEQDTFVPDFLYQSFLIVREISPNSKIGYSENNLVESEIKFYFLKQVIEHMITFIDPVLPDFIGFIIENDVVDFETLKNRMDNLQSLHIKTHIIYKGMVSDNIKTLESICTAHENCEKFEYQTYKDYTGEIEDVVISILGVNGNVNLICENKQIDLLSDHILNLNMYDLPEQCKQKSIYQFVLKHGDCDKKYVIKLEDVNVETEIIVQQMPDIDMNVYIKEAPFCVFVDDSHYKYVADIHVDFKEPNLKWTFSDENSTCISNYICTSKPCLANNDDVITVTSKEIYIEKAYAKKQTFSVDIYTYDTYLGIKYLYSKTIVNDVFINCKDMSFMDDIIEVKTEAEIKTWLSSGSSVPKKLKKSDSVTIAMSMLKDYEDINLNIETMKWTLINKDNVLEDTYTIDKHCEPCGECIFNGKNMGKHTDIVSDIKLQYFIDELYKHDNQFKSSDLKLIFDVDATLSFCDNKRRRLLSTYHISHKHVKKSTSFDIDLGKPKELKHTAPINNVDRITLTVSGGTNILITVLFVLFVSFACLCYSIHLYMPSYERKRREEEEYNFVSLE